MCLQLSTYVCCFCLLVDTSACPAGCCFTDGKSPMHNIADFRYLYTQVQIAGHCDSDKFPFFKQYRLSETKTFASFFHPEKEALLQLLDHFQHKTGKFGIAGYPDKLVRGVLQGSTSTLGTGLRLGLAD